MIGLFTSSLKAVKLSALYYGTIEHEKTVSLHSGKDYDAFVYLTDESKTEIQWWIDNVRCMNGKPIQPSQFDYELKTDASLLGCGAEIQNNVTQGFWSMSERKLHINYPELLALITVCHSFRNKHIRILCDNMTSVTYVNKIGGTIGLPSLNSLTKKI